MHKNVRKALIALQLFTLLTFIPWSVMFLMSFMAYDAGFSWSATGFIALIGSYPAVGIVTAIFSWKNYKKGKTKKALMLSLVPVAITVLFYFFIFVIPGY